MAAIPQRGGKSSQGVRNHSAVELEVAVAASQAGADPRTGEVQQPPHVFRHHEMPGWPQHVRAQNCAVIKEPIDGGGAGSTAQTQRPLPPGVVLRLHRSHPSHGVDCRVERLADQPLRPEPPGSDLAGHTR